RAPPAARGAGPPGASSLAVAASAPGHSGILISPMQAPGHLPNLLIIGAAKAGTTSLHRYLDLHPSIFMSRSKELQLFNQDDWRERRDWYRAQFPTAAPVRGESSGAYTMHPVLPCVPERIKATIPDARLIYLV